MAYNRPMVKKCVHSRVASACALQSLVFSWLSEQQWSDFSHEIYKSCVQYLDYIQWHMEFEIRSITWLVVIVNNGLDIIPNQSVWKST